MTTFMTSLPSPPDSLAPLSALPSPPTSPTSPRTATRIRIKVPRRPGSLGNVPSTTSAERHEERTRNASPSLSRIVNADPDAPDSENRTIAPVSARAGDRRKPSITYYTPSSPSPWGQRPPLSRTLSSGVDGLRDGEPVLANGKENVSQRSSLVLGSRSPSTRESVSSSDGMGAREREPLTLVEKHADLLHFIAQKERKCLELRDQLTTHETELAELKRKWERIVNRGYDPLPNPPLTAGLGGVALDGLKEGVRMIAAGFSDLGGSTQDLESSDKNTSKLKSLTHPTREHNNNASNARAKRMGSEHLSASSMSSIQEGAHASDHVLEGEEGETMATAPSLSRAGSLNCRMHKRGSRAFANEPTTPTNAFVPPLAENPKPANLDVGMSLILTPSPTLVPPPPASAAPAAANPAPKSPVLESTHGPVPVNAGQVSSWMDTMGRKLSGLQKGQTFSKSQKRASLLLAGVSGTITSALSPGPTATTPAPAPTSTTTPRILSSMIPLLTSPASTKSSLTMLPPSPQPQPQSQSQSGPHPSYETMTDWLEDDEEQQTVHAGGVLLIPDSKRQPSASVSVSVRTTDMAIERGEVAATTTAMSSFDDDDWNW